MRRAISLILCLCLILTLCSCGGGYRSDMTITSILPQNVKTLDPQIASRYSEELVLNCLFEGLCRMDREGEIQPGVAYKWDENSDSTVFVFHLRKEALWNDGTPVTAQDFVYGIRRALDPATAAPSVDELYIIKNAHAVHSGEMSPEELGVTATDDYTLTFQLEQSYPDFPATTTSIRYLPCNQTYFEESAGHYGQSSQYILCNGPFTLSGYDWNTEYGSRSLTLTRSETYKGEYSTSPYELIFKIDYSSSVETDPITALTSGEVDILNLPQETAKAAEEKGCTVATVDDAVTGLLFNPNHENLENIGIREMFFKTLDRKSLLQVCESAQEGDGEAQGIMPSCVTWDEGSYYGEGEIFYPEEDASIVSGLSSLLDSLELDSMPNITVICPNDDTSIAMANAIITSWNTTLSSAFNIEPLSQSDFETRILNGEYEAALYTLRAGGTSPFDVLRSFESTSSPTLLQDSTFDKTLHTISFDKASFQNLEKQLEEMYLFYPIYKDRTYYVLSPDVRGIYPIPDMSLDFTDAKKRS